MRYYIADCHFYHDNLNHRMDMRGFADAEQMNAHMIEQWNKKIRKNDEVVILGDFSFGKGEETNRILEQLNGKLFLIRGNHDDRYLKDRAFRKERFRPQPCLCASAVRDRGRGVSPQKALRGG